MSHLSLLSHRFPTRSHAQVMKVLCWEPSSSTVQERVNQLQEASDVDSTHPWHGQSSQRMGPSQFSSQATWQCRQQCSFLSSICMTVNCRAYLQIRPIRESGLRPDCLRTIARANAGRQLVQERTRMFDTGAHSQNNPATPVQLDHCSGTNTRSTHLIQACCVYCAS